VITRSGIAVDVLGVGLDRIPQEKQWAILTAFPRLAFKDEFKGCLCNVVRQKTMTRLTTFCGILAFDTLRGSRPQISQTSSLVRHSLIAKAAR
jgi:hypothetical protein